MSVHGKKEGGSSWSFTSYSHVESRREDNHGRLHLVILQTGRGRDGNPGYLRLVIYTRTEGERKDNHDLVIYRRGEGGTVILVTYIWLFTH